MARKKSASERLPRPEQAPVKDLYLDPGNPRLAEMGLSSEDDQEEILRVIWRNMGAAEIADSIATNGYFQHEPLFVTEENDKLFVLEGNRRLVAVKLLLDASLRTRLRATDLPTLTPAARKSLSTLPVIKCKREDIWQYVGFKHVNGPQPWDSYAKAHYIARVRNDIGTPLEQIAQTIGDRHATVRRLYRGLMALEQAEEARVFDRNDRWKTRFAFSHLYTALDYPGFQRFLGFKPGKSFEPSFVPKKNIEQLGEVCEWLFGSKSQDKEPIIRTQNPDLRMLDKVLLSPNGVAALRQGMPLRTAHEISRGDEELFREALVKAKDAMQSARGKMLHGYTGDLGLLNMAKEVYELASDLLEEMNRIREKRLKRKSKT